MQVTPQIIRTYEHSSHATFFTEEEKLFVTVHFTIYIQCNKCVKNTAMHQGLRFKVFQAQGMYHIKKPVKEKKFKK